MKHVYARILQSREIAKKLNRKMPTYVYIKIEYAVEWNETDDSLVELFYSKVIFLNNKAYSLEKINVALFLFNNYCLLFRPMSATR